MDFRMILLGLLVAIFGVLLFLSALKKKNLIAKDGPEIVGVRRVFVFILSIIVVVMCVLLFLMGIFG